ncbi:DUF3800 domain-containing protein [Effusibacillus lacus]|uniref:DUF3800 domain-containing protein n=1 Tax=Effusibacillus lacus TaxID=1348429 RepID=A0A292YHF6_9BACL|nr:DUF3800 domain-containing protein [Effusibacillus lacus]TCS75171.1 hypothetical protein EDD64_109100 [Effusibacillus lacus]GAX89118.1 hypothetical protein EFBL_0736 [Effusibacillus lacus]
MEYILYMDESAKEGPYYGNFYGGALVRSTDYDYVIDQLSGKKKELHLFKEVKWQRVTLPYLTKYIELIDVFFDLIQQDLVKMRVMFTHNYRRAINLSKDQVDNTFTMLYYQFFKHAFGLKYSNPTPSREIGLRLYFDELPVAPANRDIFKDFIHGLQWSEDFRSANLSIERHNITEVKSDEHVILQYMDIVLGAMYFRLNNLHKEKPEGSRIRGKRTIAKEKLYKHINKRIRNIYPNFNIGISTGVRSYEDRWNHPYRHWLFVPSEHKIAPEFSKKK